MSLSNILVGPNNYNLFANSITVDQLNSSVIDSPDINTPLITSLGYGTTGQNTLVISPDGSVPQPALNPSGSDVILSGINNNQLLLKGNYYPGGDVPIGFEDNNGLYNAYINYYSPPNILPSFGSSLSYYLDGTDVLDMELGKCQFYEKVVVPELGSGSHTFTMPSSSGTLALTSQIPALTLPVSVANGGTGLTTLTSGDFLVGNGTGNINLVPSSNYVDTSSIQTIGGNKTFSGTTIVNSSLGILVSPSFSLDVGGSARFQKIYTTGSTPTISIGLGAGSGATATISGSSSSGIFSVNTSGTPALNNTICTITFSGFLTTAYSILLTPATSIAAINASPVFPVIVSSTSWNLVNAGTALATGNTYSWFYTLIANS